MNDRNGSTAERTADSNESKEFSSYPATVREVIPAADAGEPDLARISVDDASEPYNEVTVNNALHNSSGGAVILAKGDHVRLRVGHCPDGAGDDDKIGHEPAAGTRKGK